MRRPSASDQQFVWSTDELRTHGCAWLALECTRRLLARGLLLFAWNMGIKHDAAPLQHDATTLRALADEADGRRHRTAFGHLADPALLRAMAAALRAYADAQEGREPAQRFESGDTQISVA